MKEINWFVEALEKEFLVEADKERISYEGNGQNLSKLEHLAN
jgi:hypothetical protein